MPSCHIVSESSIQIVVFGMPMSLQVVLLMFRSMRMRVDQRRRSETQTSSLPPVMQLVPLVPQVPPASLSLPVPLLEPQSLSVGRQCWWWTSTLL